ncbi:transketolase [Paenibacillus sp.]|uniref:transketolase n=1 Tax=Paenibacillus sp. TaxID=58172 RepID=UPI002D2E47A0|nr:transketolase [Paenibacillus sp.]HZG58105.1 transketolase [Paenibacillus sp.]
MTVDNESCIPVVSAYKPGMTPAELERAALQFRRDIIELTWRSGTHSSHVGGELSLAEVMAVLYGSILRLDPLNPDWEGRDRFILSKGHASAVQYAAMAWRGFFHRDRLWNEFNRLGGKLQEHANMELPGIEAPTGSLGMGLSNGCGMAWAAKRKGHGDGTQSKVYVVLGDGECTEGQVWEAAMCASQFRLDNLVAIVDYNKYIISGSTAEVSDLEPFAEKWESFGWRVTVVQDGHHIPSLLQALEAESGPVPSSGKPSVVIAHTTKGKGISFMEKDAVKWHAGHLDEQLYHLCLKELGI